MGGKGGASFHGGRDYPNLGTCGGLIAQILISLQTPFVHLVLKQIRARSQLKLGQSPSYLRTPSVNIRDSLVKQTVTRGSHVTKVVLCAVDPLPPTNRTLGLTTVSKAVFPRQWEWYIEFQGFPPPMLPWCFLRCSEHLALLSDQGPDS